MILWIGSFVIAATLFFLNTVLNKGIVQLLSDPSNPPTDVTPIDFGHMWVTMAGQATDPWTVMAVLLALLMVPVTLFVATVLAVSGSDTPWIRQAQETTRTVLFWSSLVVAVLSWLSIPVLWHPSTAIVSIVMVLGVSFVCSVLGGFSTSKEDLKKGQKANKAELKRLKPIERDLHAQAGVFLEGTTLSRAGRKRLFRYVCQVILAIIVVVGTWLGLGALFFSLSSEVWIVALIVLCFILLECVLAELAVYNHIVVQSKSTVVNSWFFTIFFQIILLSLTIIILSEVNWYAAGWWAAVGTFLIPLATFICWLVLSPHRLAYFHWRASTRRIRLCEKAMKANKEQRASMK